MHLWLTCGAFVAAYLIGAIPAGYLMTRLIAGVDLRGVGSGNIGFTNAARVLGWKAAAGVLIFDVLKGLGPALFFPPLAGIDPEAGLGAEAARLAIAVAPIVGHVFPIFLGFKGGKGVATSIGVFAALAWAPLLIALAVGAAVLGATRYMSLASMTGAVVMAVSTPLLVPKQPLLTALAAAVALGIIALHRANIQRLLHGTERRFGERTVSPSR